jgi:hypothetical protein
MDLRAAVARLAARRLHVLLVEVPGAAEVRWAAEAEVDRRQWVTANSAADADLVLICGAPGSALAAVLDATVDLVPRPAERAAATTAADVPGALEEALRRWVAGGLPPARPHSPEVDDSQDGAAGDGPDAEHLHHDGMDHDGSDHDGSDHDGSDHDGSDHDGMDHDGMDHGGMDHGGMDHGGMDHGGMDHGGMDMDGPGGLPLAGGAEDRDGLEMDVLHVPLGPVLPAWPGGLLLTCTLAGDVVTGAGLEVLPAAAGALAGAASAGAAGRVDLAARVLQLAGREDLAGQARMARGLLLSGDRLAAQQVWAGVGRAVHRSRLLRWSLRGVGAVDQVVVASHKLPAGLAGDVADRLAAALAVDLAAGDATVGDVAGVDVAGVDGPETGWPGPAAAGWRARLLGVVPEVVSGMELAAVRLLMASLPANVTAATAAAPPPGVVRGSGG